MPTLRRFEPHPQSAPGDFYVVNDECIACGAPHVVAPDLIGWATNTKYEHCTWKKQPETSGELEQAFAAFAVSDIGCYRYAGTDSQIISRIGSEYCDQATSNGGVLPSRVGVRIGTDPIALHFTLTASRPMLLAVKLREAFETIASFFQQQR